MNFRVLLSQCFPIICLSKSLLIRIKEIDRKSKMMARKQRLHNRKRIHKKRRKKKKKQEKGAAEGKKKINKSNEKPESSNGNTPWAAIKSFSRKCKSSGRQTANNEDIYIVDLDDDDQHDDQYDSFCEIDVVAKAEILSVGRSSTLPTEWPAMGQQCPRQQFITSTLSTALCLGCKAAQIKIPSLEQQLAGEHIYIYHIFQYNINLSR